MGKRVAGDAVEPTQTVPEPPGEIFWRALAAAWGENLPMPVHPFTFICGTDDYLVDRLGREHFAGLAADVTDEFSREIISGFANNVAEVESALNRLRESVQTISMFGGRRVVWFKDVNFLADTVTGRAESTLKLVGDLQELLAGLNPADTAVLVTAAPPSPSGVRKTPTLPSWAATMTARRSRASCCGRRRPPGSASAPMPSVCS
jgi:hypothetical protein